MSRRVISNIQTTGRFNIAGFDTLDSSGGSGDEETKPAPKQKKGEKPGGGGQSNSAKKRAKKKKAKQQQESAELRNMAFSKLSSVPRARTQSNNSESGNIGGLSHISTDSQKSSPQVSAGPQVAGGPQVTGGPKAGRKPEQWEQWKVADKGYVENQYETDLQKAILQSKLEFEQEKSFYDEIRDSSNRPDTLPPAPQSPQKLPPGLPEQTRLPPNPLYHQPGQKQTASIYQRMDRLEDFDTMPEEPVALPPESLQNAAGKKEKKKQAHAKSKISLQEFHTGGSTENGVSHPSGDSGSLLKKSSSISEEDKHFFDKVDQDVAKILSKDQMKKSRKKNEHFIAENARRVQYEDQMEQKDKVVSGLKDVIDKLKVELTQVKKRNKQLCFILAQGEMKDKADVLKQVEDLTNVKDELTTEVSELHGSLEQERSKVSSLKTELQKLQDRKK